VRFVDNLRFFPKHIENITCTWRQLSKRGDRGLPSLDTNLVSWFFIRLVSHLPFVSASLRALKVLSCNETHADAAAVTADISNERPVPNQKLTMSRSYFVN
jgi:hypothetical protein